MKTFVDRLLQNWQNDPHRTALILPRGRMTAGELADQVLQWTRVLGSRRLGPGDVIALLTESDSSHLVSVRYAAHLLGATFVQLRSANARCSGGDLGTDDQRTLVQQAGVEVLIVDREHRSDADLLIDRSRIIGTDECVDPCADRRAGTSRNGAVPARSTATPDDIAVLDLTSGTTSLPKLVRHTFGGREFAVTEATGGTRRSYRPVLMSCTPIYQSTSTMVDAALLAGGSVIVAPAVTAEQLLSAVAEHSVTDLYLPVPLLYSLVRAVRDSGRARLRTVHRAVYTGVVASPALVQEAFEVLGDCLSQLYGSTEAGGISVLTPQDHDEVELMGSVGRPLPWVRTQIRDAHDRICGAGETGEILVSSPTLMDGYATDLESSRSASEWFRTGDIGFLDRYGYLHLEGRIGQMVKAHGAKIHPAEVEKALTSHPEVDAATVFGVTDPAAGEVLHAVIVGAHPDLNDELAAQVEDTLSAEHVPDNFAFVDSIPLTVTGKPDLVWLRAWVSAGRMSAQRAG